MALPRFLYRNLIAEAAALTVSSTATGYSVASLSDGRPYTWWGPATMPASIEVDAGCPVDADGLYIPAHTLDTALCDVSVYAADLPFSGMQLLAAPEDLNDAVWVKSGGITVTVNSTVAPDGTTTADSVNFSVGTDFLNQQLAAYPAVIDAKVTISISAKTTTQIVGFGGASPTGTDVYSVGPLEANGFYRQSVTRTFTETTSAKFLQCIIYGTLFGVGSIAAWGAMVNAGSTAAPYIPQTAGRWISEEALCYSNRIPSPRDLTVGVGLSGATVLGNQAYAPNGSKEMMLVTDAGGSTGIIGWPSGGFAEYHNAESGIGTAMFIRKTVADPAYAALSTVILTGGVTTEQMAVINTNTGQISAASATLQGYGIEDAGDCWWVWLRGAAGAVANSKVAVQFYPAYNTTGTLTAAAATTGSKYIWGGDHNETLGRPAPYHTDAPLYLPFAKTTKRYWLLRFNRKSGAALCAFGEIVLGKSLECPIGVQQGFDPIGRKPSGARFVNEKGHSVGRSIDFEAYDQTLQLDYVSWSWARNVFRNEWGRSLRSAPFGFIWDYESKVEDVALLSAAAGFDTPHRSGAICSLRLPLTGVAP